VRGFAVLLGGLIYETFAVLLPGWLRQTRLYKATIGGLLRILIEFVGGLSGIIPPDEIGSQEFAMRKAAGTGVELAGFMMMGLSPIWLFAAIADIAGGTRTYLHVLVTQLKSDGLLPEDADIASVDELLDTLEDTSGQLVEMVDIPPLNVVDMRTSWRELKRNTSDLPDTDRLARLYESIQSTAKQENSSLESVSAILAAGAAKAGIQIGQTYIFEYYQEALRLIQTEGLEFYSRRISRPYLMAASAHFEPLRLTLTERLLNKIRPTKRS
jgi:hypothetical protein